MSYIDGFVAAVPQVAVRGGVGILSASPHAFTGNRRSDDFMLHRHSRCPSSVAFLLK